jgi:hypothetical protein
MIERPKKSPAHWFISRATCSATYTQPHVSRDGELLALTMTGAGAQALTIGSIN